MCDNMPFVCWNFLFLQDYNKHCTVDSSFQLEPYRVKSFSFSFPATQSSVRDTIDVSTVWC